MKETKKNLCPFVPLSPCIETDSKCSFYELSATGLRQQLPVIHDDFAATEGGLRPADGSTCLRRASSQPLHAKTLG